MIYMIEKMSVFSFLNYREGDSSKIYLSAGDDELMNFLIK